MSQIEDMEAVNAYFSRIVAVTPLAVQHKASWFTWYNNLGPIDKRYVSGVWDEARARRNQFNLANAKTPDERKQIEYVMATGVSTESIQGKTAAEIEAKRREIAEIGAKVNQQVANAGAVYPTLRRGSKGE